MRRKRKSRLSKSEKLERIKELEKRLFHDTPGVTNDDIKRKRQWYNPDGKPGKKFVRKSEYDKMYARERPPESMVELIEKNL